MSPSFLAFLPWLSCKYSKRGSNRFAGKEGTGDEVKGPGTIVARYKISGKEIEADSLKILWTCHVDGEHSEDNEEHFFDNLDYDSRGYEIHHPKLKCVYSIRVETILEEYGSPVTISSPTVYCQIPGAPDPPLIACRRITKSGFTLEWNELQTYGGNEIGGYHVCVNGSKMGKVLPTTCRSCTVPCSLGM